MASEFKSVSFRQLPEFSQSQQYATLYTVPAGRRAIVLMAQVANTAPAQVGVQLRWLDASAGASAWTWLADGVQVPAAAAIGLLSGKLVLEAGDSLQAAQEGSPLNALDITVSLLEIDA